MNKDLVLFQRAFYELRDTREAFTPIKEQWYSWNYWAQHRADFSYSQWMIDCNIWFDEVRAKFDYPEADVSYERENGHRYLSAWRGARLAVMEAENKFDSIFKKAWKMKSSDGEYLFSNEELGEVIGKDAEQLRKFASKRSWYFPRNKKGNK